MFRERGGLDHEIIGGSPMPVPVLDDLPPEDVCAGGFVPTDYHIGMVGLASAHSGYIYQHGRTNGMFRFLDDSTVLENFMNNTALFLLFKVQGDLFTFVQLVQERPVAPDGTVYRHLRVTCNDHEGVARTLYVMIDHVVSTVHPGEFFMSVGDLNEQHHLPRHDVSDWIESVAVQMCRIIARYA